MSGGLVRLKRKYLHFLCKRMNSNPSHSPIHFRSLANILRRIIRGMIPHKTKRGEAAFKVLRLQDGHEYCLLGHLSKEVGWDYANTIRISYCISGFFNAHCSLVAELYL